MPNLYSKAEGDIVWLGPEEPDSTVAMNLLRELGSKVVVDWNAYICTPVLGSDHTVETRSFMDRGIRLTYTQAEISAVAKILQRSWFEYLWIVQEICLAPPNIIVQCGKIYISWDQFSNAIFLLHTQRWNWGLLEDTRKQKRSDPIDRIFAILSFAIDLNFKPDYTKSVEETFKAVMLSYLSSTRALDTVISVGCQKQSYQGPTWVPDWSNLPPLNPLPQHPCFSMAAEIRRVISSLLEQPEPSSISKCDMAAMAQTLTLNALAGNYYPEDENDPNLKETQECIVSLLEAQIVTEAGNKNEYTGRFKKILDHIQFFCCGRSLYIKEKGKFGLGPQTIRSGDHIAVFLGSNLPAALRPISHNKWQVLIETYLNGFGNCESLLGPLPDDVKVVSRLDSEVGSRAYLDESTGTLEIEDPRLRPLNAVWIRKKHLEDHRWTWYVNTETGEEREKEVGDPRLDYDELLKLSISLQEFILV